MTHEKQQNVNLSVASGETELFQEVNLGTRRSSQSLSFSPVPNSLPGSNLTRFGSSESLVAKDGKYRSNLYVSSSTTSLHSQASCASLTPTLHKFDDDAISHKTPIRHYLTFCGLFFTIFLSGLDQTVTSTILTRIADDFKALDRIEWVPTIFMLCSTCLNIISGRIADIFGRYSVLLSSLVMFVAGAVVSAAAENIVVFIAARGLSGLACGGMLNLSIIVISDLVSIQNRGKYLGALQICFGVSNAIGPLIGGLFADRISWRAAFIADMAMGTVTLVYLAVVLRLPRPAIRKTLAESIRNLDYIGISVIIASISLTIVGLNIGGTILLWSSPVTIGCLAAGAILLGAFIVIELKLPQIPLVPMWLFTVRNLVITFSVTFLCGMTMFSIIFYMPVYFSAVFGANAMRAGLLVLPFGMALSVSSFASGYFMSTPGMYRQLLRLGPAIMVVGTLAMAAFSGKTSEIIYAVLLAIPGIGMGNVIVSNIIAAQATTDKQHIATVTPLCEFFLSIGGVIGVAVFGAVHRNQLSNILAQVSASESLVAQAIIDEARRDVSVAYAAHVSNPLRMKIAEAYATSIQQALYLMLPCLVLAFALSLFLDKNPKPQPEEIALEHAHFINQS
ncbi:hypothetical protein IWW36_001859 [Coemansia brasiliensis]|uniref:Major facilitator superfamily (MFS) profile domain-containing protein n=1 Tax=Coemansia brasiliensis TaxID=2650707 RepID=A0A9W8IFX9_9FUNG|nr:hypothetical protein IWW36_001859 [Coemansia brasiliensis]